MNVDRLDKKVHDRSNFDCGVEELNNYLKAISGQHDKKDLARTFVLTSKQNPSQIKGFYSLALCTVELDDLPASIAKKYPTSLHCALIARLGVSNQLKRQGFGSILLIDAVRKAIASSETMPVPMIIVDAKNDIAKNMYMDLGFTPFTQMSNRLYMTMSMAKSMIAKVDSA